MNKPHNGGTMEQDENGLQEGETLGTAEEVRQLLIDGGMLTLDEPYEYDFDTEGR